MNLRTGRITLAAIAIALVSASAMATELDTDAKKLGYIIGLDIGNSFKQQGTEVDLDTFFEAVKTAYTGGKPAMTPEEIKQVKDEFIKRRQAEMAAKQKAEAESNAAKGEAFLAENAKKPGVKVTASGLQYEVVTMGTGPKPAATDTVKVNYEGSLLDGTVFDSSYKRNEPVTFALDHVIPGWTEGVQLMPVGSTFKLYVKPELAYGATGGGPIPPNSTLVFKIELLGIEPGSK